MPGALFLGNNCHMMSMMKRLIPLVFSAALFVLSCGSSGNGESGVPVAAAPADLGATVFSEKCSMCHDFNADKIGPALKGVHTRWGGDTARLKAFIRNSQTLIKGGDTYANELYAKWNQSVMPPFEGLSPAELDALIQYLQ